MNAIPKISGNEINLSAVKEALKEQYMAQALPSADKMLSLLELADAVEKQDIGSASHNDRISAYIGIMVDALQVHGLYADELSGVDKELLCSSSRLHDIGKLSISDKILNKPGKLTDEEFEIMKTHTTEGERIMDQVDFSSENDEFLRNAKLFAGYHHERWDGKGYPHGLGEDEIPLQGRIMAIVDVYDALVSQRPYKIAFTPDEAASIIMDCSGKQFDPIIADLFYEVRMEFEEVAIRNQMLEDACIQS